ncbi:MAG TPA: AtpZ/AtpI family protein [Acidimicrobiales bacterium]|nr:AtpZ/AtpI family protein [Acidimicrobiales bacterium]
MDLRALAERRDLNSGFGDSLARAFEIVFTPFVFGVFGWWIDGRTGTRPLFALGLGILVMVVTLWKLSRGYMTRMDAETDKVLGGEEGRDEPKRWV